MIFGKRVSLDHFGCGIVLDIVEPNTVVFQLELEYGNLPINRYKRP